MQCPNCQTENPEGARFCFNCGTALAQSCKNCGTNLPAGAKFCFNCGQATGTAAPSQSTSPPAPPVSQPAGDLLQRYIPKGLMSKLEAARNSGLMEGERRIVTILFCDVKGSTAAAAHLDPEEWSEIINGAFEHMIQPVYQYEGTVARLMGDGLLAFFGAPIAHEDDPQRAILAGLEIVRLTREYALKVKEQWGLAFDVRVGINTGLVVVGAVGSDLRMEYTALGDAINIAARMEQTAVPGTVQIASPTHKLVEPLFDFEMVENLEIKGVDRQVTAYRVLQPRAEPGTLRGIAELQAPLVGRETQIDGLNMAIFKVRQGEGQIVSLIGEAGLGKSRLISELKREVVSDPAFSGRWVEGRSQSFETNTPFAPFADLLDDYFELEDGQNDKSKVGQIRERVELLMPGQGNALTPFFATMLGLELEPDDLERVKYLEPPHLRGLIFNHIRDLLAAHLAHQPLVMVLDDLHWVDPISLELLESLLPLVLQSQLLILAAFRPRPTEPSWGFHEKSGQVCSQSYHAFFLDPLDQNQSRELVANLLEVEDLPASVRQMILDKSEGNPFFLEEIIRSLLDAGLVIQQDGHWRATREIVDISFPDTLVGVITTRLDRLEEKTRQIAQAAAVLGREFSFETLADVVTTPELIETAMSELQQREIIFEKSRLPRRTYLFKHALTQQASYDSILLSNRRELHRRAAESLISRHPDDPASIARHWLNARQPSKALPYLVIAGDKAIRAYATGVAIDFYTKAIELCDESSPLAPMRSAYEGLGNALAFANRIPEAIETFEKLLALGESRREPATQISALNKLASTAALRMGQFQLADSYLDRANALAEKHQEKSGVAETTLIYCQMCSAKADFDGVVHHMGELAKIGQDIGNPEYTAMGLEHVSSSLIWLTRFDEAQKKAEEALALSREIGDRLHEAWALTTPFPMCSIRDGDLESAKAYLAEGQQIAEKIGALEPQIIANWLLGEIAQWEGNHEAAITLGQKALDLALPFEEFMPWFVVPPLGSLGTAYLHVSEEFKDEVLKFHQHALRLLESPTGMMMGGTTWADLGICALTIGDLEVARDSFHKGLNVPTIFMHLERPRLLAGSALVAMHDGDLEKAISLVREAVAIVDEKKMRNMIPLTHIFLGLVHSARGEIDAAVAALDRAETEAIALNMRHYILHGRLMAHQILSASGREAEAQAKREQARMMIEEIAASIQDQTLRNAFRKSALAKTNA